MKRMIGHRWRRFTQILRVYLPKSVFICVYLCLFSLLGITVVFLTACTINPPDEPNVLAAVPAWTAVPPAAQPTIAPPQLPTAVPTSLPTPTATAILPEFTNHRNDSWQSTAADAGAEFVLLTPANTGLWQFPAGSFIHPIALAIWRETAFLLDGGRVLAVDLSRPAAPATMLAPGMDVAGARVLEPNTEHGIRNTEHVAGVRVLEPLDLTVSGDELLVLDRAGDVYATDLPSGAWRLARYDRPVRDTSGHYFVALDGAGDGRYLLETNYLYTMRYAAGERDALWTLPESHAVDVSVSGADVFVLLRAMAGTAGSLSRYRDTRLMDSFQPQFPIEQPRQVVAGETAVFALDRAGLRLLAFDGENGRLQTLYQLPPDDPISAFVVDPDGQLILAGRDRLYFYARPDWLLTVPGAAQTMTRLHDTAVLSALSRLAMPIGGSGITRRDLQMPGAPRHYRLGIHQGVDFYWQPGTPVLAAADGVVIRATVDYAPPTQAQFNAWRAEVQQLGYTSDAALDVYRGRQVWVQHENGLVTRYIHLSRIAPGVVAGTAVTQGQLLGEVGNSGSILSLESETADAHLHFEIWLNEQYLGQFLRPIETRAWVETMLRTN